MMLAAFGAKLWLIALYSNPTPYWDEWSALLGSAYLPYFDSTLSLQDFLAPHNEHRMATTRLAGLLLMLANGLWDPVLQMIFNTVIHVSTAVFILLVLGQRLDTFGSAALAVLLMIVIAVPYSWENTLWGVETQFCSVNLFSLLAVYLIVREGDLSALSVVGLIFGVLAFFSAASGALVFLACLPVIVCYRFLGLVKGWRPWLLAALLLLAFVLGVAFTPRLEYHKVLAAQSVRDFRHAYLWLVSWPLSSHPNFGGVVVNLPWMWLTWRTLRKPPEAGNIAWILVALGSWDVLQFSALAYGRAPIVSSSRYLDGVALNVILNCICLGMLAGRRWLVQVVWAAFVVAGLYTQSGKAFSDAQLRHVTALREESNVKSFLASGHFLPGASPADLSLPYPDPRRLRAWLSDPKVRRILPSNLQAAIPKDEVGSDVRRDRLGFLRDALLRSGPFLTGLGTFLLLALIAGFALQAGHPRRAMSLGRAEGHAPTRAEE
jgi:hypothetical protein